MSSIKVTDKNSKNTSKEHKSSSISSSPSIGGDQRSSICSSIGGKSLTASTTSMASTAAEGRICYLCQRKFPTVEKLRRHEFKSALHMKNLELEKQKQQQQERLMKESPSSRNKNALKSSIKTSSDDKTSNSSLSNKIPKKPKKPKKTALKSTGSFTASASVASASGERKKTTPSKQTRSKSPVISSPSDRKDPPPPPPPSQQMKTPENNNNKTPPRQTISSPPLTPPPQQRTSSMSLISESTYAPDTPISTLPSTSSVSTSYIIEDDLNDDDDEATYDIVFRKAAPPALSSIGKNDDFFVYVPHFKWKCYKCNDKYFDSFVEASRHEETCYGLLQSPSENNMMTQRATSSSSVSSKKKKRRLSTPPPVMLEETSMTRMTSGGSSSSSKKKKRRKKERPRKAVTTSDNETAPKVTTKDNVEEVSSSVKPMKDDFIVTDPFSVNILDDFTMDAPATAVVDDTVDTCTTLQEATTSMTSSSSLRDQSSSAAPEIPRRPVTPVANDDVEQQEVVKEASKDVKEAETKTLPPPPPPPPPSLKKTVPPPPPPPPQTSTIDDKSDGKSLTTAESPIPPSSTNNNTKRFISMSHPNDKSSSLLSPLHQFIRRNLIYLIHPSKTTKSKKRSKNNKPRHSRVGLTCLHCHTTTRIMTHPDNNNNNDNHSYSSRETSSISSSLRSGSITGAIKYPPSLQDIYATSRRMASHFAICQECPMSVTKEWEDLKLLKEGVSSSETTAKDDVREYYVRTAKSMGLVNVGERGDGKSGGGKGGFIRFKDDVIITPKHDDDNDDDNIMTALILASDDDPSTMTSPSRKRPTIQSSPSKRRRQNKPLPPLSKPPPPPPSLLPTIHLTYPSPLLHIQDKPNLSDYHYILLHQVLPSSSTTLSSSSSDNKKQKKGAVQCRHCFSRKWYFSTNNNNNKKSKSRFFERSFQSIATHLGNCPEVSVEVKREMTNVLKTRKSEDDMSKKKQELKEVGELVMKRLNEIYNVDNDDKGSQQVDDGKSSVSSSRKESLLFHEEYNGSDDSGSGYETDNDLDDNSSDDSDDETDDDDDDDDDSENDNAVDDNNILNVDNEDNELLISNSTSWKKKHLNKQQQQQQQDKQSTTTDRSNDSKPLLPLSQTSTIPRRRTSFTKTSKGWSCQKCTTLLPHQYLTTSSFSPGSTPPSQSYMERHDHVCVGCGIILQKLVDVVTNMTLTMASGMTMSVVGRHEGFMRIVGEIVGGDEVLKRFYTELLMEVLLNGLPESSMMTVAAVDNNKETTTTLTKKAMRSTGGDKMTIDDNDKTNTSSKSTTSKTTILVEVLLKNLKNHYPINLKDNERVLQALADFGRCGLEGLWFDFVENEYFVEFVRLMNPAYELPCVTDLMGCW